MDFVIGGLAGAGATIFSNPIDVVKTRLQLQGELQSKQQEVVRYRGMLHAFYVIARTDGPLALQKGLVPAVILGFTMNSIRLGMYRVAEVRGWTSSSGGDVSLHKAMLWSGMSGIVGSAVANPVYVLKTRMQAASHPSIAVGQQFRYNGMLDGISKIYSSEGIRGYFAGVSATCSRIAVGSMAQLTTFSKAKEWLKSHGVCARSPFWLSFLASACSGAAVALAACPLDVTTVRLYNQPRSPETGGGLLYSGVLDALRKIYLAEGLHGLYKGLGPLYMRITPHTTLSLVIWDMLNLYMKDKPR